MRSTRLGNGLAFTLYGLICGTAACSMDARREEFPRFVGSRIFPSLAHAGEGAGLRQGAGNGSAAWVHVGLPRGFQTVLPCHGGWQWGGDGANFLAVHRSGGPARPLEVVIAVEVSEGISQSQRTALVSAAMSLVREQPGDASIGIVIFGGQLESMHPLAGAGNKEELIAFLRRARSTAGSNLRSALGAIAVMFSSGEDVERRAVVLSTAEAGAQGAARVAESLGRSGVSVNVLSLGEGSRLASVARAGRGSFKAAAGLEELSASGSCMAFAREPTGGADAWILAQALESVDLASETMMHFRFLSTVDPGLSGIDRINRVAMRVIRRQLDPAGLLPESEPGGGESDAGAGSGLGALSLLTPTLGGGLGHRSDVRTWTGWRWVGENQHRVRLRVGSATGTFTPLRLEDLRSRLGAGIVERLGLSSARTRDTVRRVAQAAGAVQRVVGAVGGGEARDLEGEMNRGLERGAPTRLLLGHAGPESTEASGIGFAMVCARDACEHDRALADWLGEMRAPSPEMESVEAGGGAEVAELAGVAGFIWVDLGQFQRAPRGSVGERSTAAQTLLRRGDVAAMGSSMVPTPSLNEQDAAPVGSDVVLPDAANREEVSPVPSPLNSTIPRNVPTVRPAGAVGVRPAGAVGMRPAGAVGVRPAGAVGVRPAGAVGVRPAGAVGVRPAGAVGVRPAGAGVRPPP